MNNPRTCAICTRQTGQVVRQERLNSSDGANSLWSSIVLADGKLYVPQRCSDAVVLKASRQFALIRKNSDHEPTKASLAVSGGNIVLRTDKSLWCIGGIQSPNNREAGRDRGAVPA